MTHAPLPPATSCRRSLLGDGGIAYRLCHARMGLLGTVCLTLDPDRKTPRVHVEWPQHDSQEGWAREAVLRYAESVGRAVGVTPVVPSDPREEEACA